MNLIIAAFVFLSFEVQAQSIDKFKSNDNQKINFLNDTLTLKYKVPKQGSIIYLYGNNIKLGTIEKPVFVLDVTIDSNPGKDFKSSTDRILSVLKSRAKEDPSGLAKEISTHWNDKVPNATFELAYSEPKVESYCILRSEDRKTYFTNTKFCLVINRTPNAKSELVKLIQKGQERRDAIVRELETMKSTVSISEVDDAGNIKPHK